MGFDHIAFCTVTVLVFVLCMTALSSSLSIPQHPLHPSLSRGKALSRTYGPLTQKASHSSHYTRVTKLTNNAPPVINLPPTISNTSNNRTSANDTIKIELCMDCVEFMQTNLQDLINIVTKIGVTDACDKICNMLNSSTDITMCNDMCVAVGSEKFWQLFVSAGINPIYACEMVNACVAGTFPAVSFTSASITPATGPPGTSFNFKVQFTVINETGVGESAFVVYYPTEDDHELGFISQQVFADYTPGKYEATLTFPTNSTFVVGKYLVMFDLCSGECGQDPDPYPFAEEELSFNITASL